MNGRQRATGGRQAQYASGRLPHPALILGCVSSATDRRTIADVLPRDTRVLWCADASTLLRTLDNHAVAALVVELHADGDTPLPELVKALQDRGGQLPLLLRFDLTPRTARQIAALQGTSLDIRLSLRGFDVLDSAVGRLLSCEAFGLPELAVVSRLAQHAGARLVDVMVGASVIGAGNATVGDLARSCASSTRRLEERLLQERMPHPKRLLMWVLCVCTIWRVSRLRWSAQDTAIRAGFRSADILSRRLARFTGMRLSELVERVSCEEALDGLSAELRELAAAPGAARTESNGRAFRLSSASSGDCP